jgi:hypothetical protein
MVRLRPTGAQVALALVDHRDRKMGEQVVLAAYRAQLRLTHRSNEWIR